MISVLICVVLIQCKTVTRVDLIIGYEPLYLKSILPLDPAKYFYPVDPSKPTVLDPNKPTPLNGNPHFMSGIRQEGDKLLYSRRLTSLVEALVTKTWGSMYIPVNGRGTITSIQLISQKPAYLTGSVSIIEGGVTMKFVALKFKSQSGTNIDYVVNIFGTPNH